MTPANFHSTLSQHNLTATTRHVSQRPNTGVARKTRTLLAAKGDSEAVRTVTGSSAKAQQQLQLQGKRTHHRTVTANRQHNARPRLTMETSLVAAGVAGVGVLALLYRQFSAALASRAQETVSSTTQAITQVVCGGVGGLVRL